MMSKYLSHITSLFYSLVLPRKAKLAFPSKSTPERHRTGEAGLKTLFHSELKPPTRVVHRCTTQEAAESEPSSPPPPTISRMWAPASGAFRTTMMGDVIGTESGDCMITYMEELVEPESPILMMRCREKSAKRKRQLPPPLTLMAETREMPWAFTRECDGDGRLIVTAERVRRGREHCIMEVRTEDERVTMRLVPEDNDCCELCCYPIDDDVDDDDDDDGEVQFNEGFKIEERGLEFVEELAKKVSSESERCGDLRECISLNSYASGPGWLLQPHISDSFPDIYLGQPASAPIRPMTPCRRLCGQFLSGTATFVEKPCEATNRSLTFV
ncbi:uncharacterized protein LOC111241615 [Vigna radiata var. radiata]|uniref:Uncharacterized protein LOC111241615 n=1 Tax=Vigna radiata var. radiata TaxID=3916 RepID=A0A3Q0F089_VIGRR|nr:uncharacterized protein LOC111241615 [Vigna radiata var. radiata]